MNSALCDARFHLDQGTTGACRHGLRWAADAWQRPHPHTSAIQQRSTSSAQQHHCQYRGCPARRCLSQLAVATAVTPLRTTISSWPPSRVRYERGGACWRTLTQHTGLRWQQQQLQQPVMWTAVSAAAAAPIMRTAPAHHHTPIHTGLTAHGHCPDCQHAPSQ